MKSSHVYLNGVIAMTELNAKILGKIILLQSTLHAMQDDHAMAHFVCRGLVSIPGIHGVGIFIRGHLYGEGDLPHIPKETCQSLYRQLVQKNVVADANPLSAFQTTFQVECIKIETIFKCYGFFWVRSEKGNDFKSVRPYLENTLNLIALVIENNTQNAQLMKHKVALEQAVIERTKALKESEERFMALAQSSRDGIIGYDTDMCYTFWNKTMEKISGLAAAKVLGQNAFELFPFLMEVGEDAAFRKTLRGESVFMPPMPFNIPASERNGWFVSSHYPILDTDGGVKGGLAIIHDITEEKKAEQEKRKIEAQLRQAQKMEAIGTLAGGIAHDFNNIIAIIIGNTELSMDDVPEDAGVYEFLHESLTASLRAKELVKQILDFSRKVQPVKERVSFTSIIEETLKFIRASLPSSIKIVPSLHCPCDLVYANPTQLNQIIMNLCTNAAHAMDLVGELEVSLGNTKIEPNDPYFQDLAPQTYVKLSIADTGCGIPRDHLEKIFDPYFTTKAVGKGSGLGLAVVYGIVKSHEGRVKVYSEPGKGTTFNIFLPCLECRPIKHNKMRFAIPHGEETILFIDDEEMLTRMAHRILTALGYKLTCETNPLVAYKIFETRPHYFDLVITDMTMPDLTGDRLARKMLAVRPNIPIILCTGHSEKIDIDGAHKVGIRKFLMKPVTKDMLAQAIREVLDQQIIS